MSRTKNKFWSGNFSKKIDKNKMATYLFILLISSFISPFLGYELITTFYNGVSVPQYNGIGSLMVITHTVEQSADQSVWEIDAIVDKPDKCPQRNITYYIQYGSIPVAQFRNNQTFPADFAINRSYLYGPFSIQSGMIQGEQLMRPPAGEWFLAAYLEDNRNTAVVKVTSVSCKYGIQVNVTQGILNDVIDLSPNLPLTLTISERITYFKTYITKMTYSAEIAVDCGSTSSSCPVIISSRRAAVPFPQNDTSQLSSHGTLTKDCTNVIGQYCRLTVDSPDIEQWLHTFVQSSINQNFSVSISVTTSEIGKVMTDSLRSRRNSDLNGGSNADSNSIASNNRTGSPANNSKENTVIPAFIISSSDKENENISLNSFFLVVDKNNSFVKIKPVNDSMSSKVDNYSIQRIRRSENRVFVNDSFITDRNSLSSVTATGNGSDPIVPVVIYQLLRLENPSSRFYTLFGTLSKADVLLFEIAEEDEIVLFRFDMHPIKDIGSTLIITLGKIEIEKLYGPKDYNETLKLCIQKARLPVSTDGTALSCFSNNQSDTISISIMLNESMNEQTVMMPFPEPGAWFIGSQLECYKDGVKVRCVNSGGLGMQVYTYACPSGCDNGGDCKSYSAGVYSYASCGCVAGYDGYTCSDSTLAQPTWVQLIQTLLLTLSNLFFIPAIIVAVLRRRPSEAIVYTANMFFSTFYHACDMSTWSMYILCIMPYGVLSFCDFLCSLLSFWVTLIAIARIRPWSANAAHMFAAILLAMGVRWNAQGVVTNIVPIACGCVIIIISWSVQSYRKKSFYPGKKDVLFMIPGILLAILGLCLFAFVETDSNYPYTHSSWHVCMSVCIVFLLPRKKAHLEGGTGCTSVSVDVESEDIKLVNSNQVNTGSMDNEISFISAASTD